jgi:allophanate hydrolase subunit 1
MSEPDDFAEDPLDYAIRALRREGLYELVDAVDAMRAENVQLRQDMAEMQDEVDTLRQLLGLSLTPLQA